MYKLVSLEVDGLHKFGKSKIEIPTTPGPWLITGQNLDSNKANSNGAGKTGIPNAVSWVLTGKIPGKGSNVAPAKGYKKIFATVKLVAGKTELIITRTKTKSSTKLTLTLNGEELDASGEGTKKPQVQLNELLGFPDSSEQSYDAFLNTVYLSFDEVRGFADVATTSADRVALLVKYLGLDKLDKVLFSLRADRIVVKGKLDKLMYAQETFETNMEDSDAIQDEIAELEDKIEQIVNRQGKVQEELDALPDIAGADKRRLEMQRDFQEIGQRRINELDPIRKRYKGILALQKVLPEMQHELDDLGYLDDEAIIDLEARISNFTDEMGATRDVKTKYQSELDAKLLALSGLRNGQVSLECPYCEGDLLFSGAELVVFNKKNHLQLEYSTQEEVEKLQAFYKQSSIQLAEINQRKTALVKKLSNQRQTVGQYTLLQDRIRKATTEVGLLDEVDQEGVNIATYLHDDEDLITQKYRDLPSENAVNEYRGQLQEFVKEAERLSILRDRLNGTLKGVQARHEIAVKQEQRLLKLIEDTREAREEYLKVNSAVLVIPQFRATELARIIPELETLTNEALSEMESEFRVRFELNVTPSRTELTILVSDEEGTWRGFGTYSSGERQRVALACAMAQHTVAQSAGGYMLDFMFMDEVIDGLDVEGRSALINYLPNHPLQYFIISHGNVGDLITREIQVTRQHGEATFSIVR